MTTFLTLEDCETLRSSLTSTQVTLEHSGDYPEKQKHQQTMKNLNYTIFYLKKGGEMTVLND